MNETKTRKVVIKLSQVLDAFQDFKDALESIGYNPKSLQIITPLGGGFQLVGDDTGKLPDEWSTREEVYQTLQTFTAAIVLTKMLLGTNLVVSEPEEAPEVAATAPAPRKPRVAASK